MLLNLLTILALTNNSNNSFVVQAISRKEISVIPRSLRKIIQDLISKSSEPDRDGMNENDLTNSQIVRYTIEVN